MDGLESVDVYVSSVFMYLLMLQNWTRLLKGLVGLTRNIAQLLGYLRTSDLAALSADFS